MSLDNASLLRVDAPPATAAGGDLAAYIPGAALSTRCILDEPTFVIQRQIDQLKLDSTAVLYVEVAIMPAAASVLIRNAQVQVQPDGGAPMLYRIDRAIPLVLGGVSHVQCLLRVA